MWNKYGNTKYKLLDEPMEKRAGNSLNLNYELIGKHLNI